MKNLLFLLSLFLVTQSYGQQTIVYPDSAYEVVPVDIFETSDGGYLIVSNFWDYSDTIIPLHTPPLHVDLIKTDALGNQQWSKKHIYTINGYAMKGFLDANDNLTLFARTEENTICSYLSNPKGNTYYIIRYDNLGNELMNVNLVPDCDEVFLGAVEVPGGFVVNGRRWDGAAYHTFKASVDVNGNVTGKQLTAYNGRETKIALSGNTIFAPAGYASGIRVYQYNLQGQPVSSISYPNAYANAKIIDCKTTQDLDYLVLAEVYDAQSQSWLFELSKLSPNGAITWQKYFLNRCIAVEERADNQFYLLKQSTSGLDAEITLLSATGDSLSTTFHSDPVAAAGTNLILAPNGLDYIGTGTVGCCFNAEIYGSGDAAIFSSLQLSNNSEITSFPSTIYPNPANQVITLSVPEAPKSSMQFEVFDLAGKIVYKTTITQQETTLNLPNTLTGFFVYKLQSNNKISSGKLIIE